MTSALSHWVDYPMGPHLRAFLEISDEDYKGERAAQPDKARLQDFSDFLVAYFDSHHPANGAQFIDLLEELTSMGLSMASVRLADKNAQFPIDGDFRACLALGSSLMLESELDEAALLLRQAQAQAPMELAPYVNLASIYFAMEKDSEALLWAERGLQVDANHPRLWEIIASIYLYEDKESAGEKIRAKAEATGSYSGLSLAAEVIDPNDKLLKSQFLEDAFNAGSRDEEFLIEYTAALGMARQFEKIPQVIFRLENIEKKPVHWKLFAHAAQAYLAMNQEAEAAEQIKKASRSPNASPQVLEDLQRIYDEERPAHTH